MVGGSELAFRLLCRRHGADLCYTPMMYSGKFVENREYREMEFATCIADRPLVAHFCGNDPVTLLQAAKLVEGSVDAVDLNLGCPQRVAFSGHFGSYLLNKEDHPLVFRIVRELARGLSIPVFCKIRLLDTLDETLAFCQSLQEAGCALLAVHARYRGTATRRRDGAADLNQVREIKQRLSIPVLSNGNTATCQDVIQNLELTGADGIMSAEGLLDNPALFETPRSVLEAVDLRHMQTKLRKTEHLMKKRRRGASSTDADPAIIDSNIALKESIRKIEQKGIKSIDHGRPVAEAATPISRLNLALEYLDLAEQYPVGASISTVAFHVRRMCKPEFTGFQLMSELEAEGQNIAGVRSIVERALGYVKRGDYVFDHAKAKREDEARAWQKYQLECRKKFEARAARKARREGRDPGYYLRPTSVPGGEVLGQDPSWLAENS